MSMQSAQEGGRARIDPQTAYRKLRLADGLFQMALEAKKFQLKRANPELDERELGHMAYALIEKGCK